MSNNIWVYSDKFLAACEAYIKNREKHIEELRQEAIFKLTLKRRWFRRNMTKEEALFEYIASGEWDEVDHTWLFQFDRVKQAKLAAEVAIANKVNTVTLTDQNIKDVGRYLCDVN